MPPEQQRRRPVLGGAGTELILSPEALLMSTAIGSTLVLGRGRQEEFDPVAEHGKLFESKVEGLSQDAAVVAYLQQHYPVLGRFARIPTVPLVTHR